MRVAIVVRTLKIGGMERVAVNLAEAFADEGDESHLIYFKDKQRAYTPKDNVHFHYFNLYKTLKLTIIGAIAGVLAKILNGIFRGSYFIYAGYLLTPIFKYKLKALEKKYGRFDLIIMRGHGTYELIWPMKDDRVVQMVESIFIKQHSRLDKFYTKVLYSGKNIAGVSSGVVEEIKKITNRLQIKPKSLHVVNNPIDVQTISHEAEAYVVEEKQKFILSVGRITFNKNLSLLIDAYQYAREYLGLNLPLVIIGEGEDLENIKRKVDEYGLNEHIRFLGFLKNPYPWIKQAEILALTSKAEGLGMVMLEALACRTKIVSTESRGGIRDIMADELESYMTNFDAEAFAKKMVEIIDEGKEWDFDKHIKKFRPETIVKRYKELYL